MLSSPATGCWSHGFLFLLRLCSQDMSPTFAWSICCSDTGGETNYENVIMIDREDMQTSRGLPEKHIGTARLK